MSTSLILSIILLVISCVNLVLIIKMTRPWNWNKKLQPTLADAVFVSCKNCQFEMFYSLGTDIGTWVCPKCKLQNAGPSAEGKA